MTAAVASARIAGLDARLPGLDALFDLDSVAARFERAWETEVVACTLLGARYEPGSRCVATYAVILQAAQVIGVVELTPDDEIMRRAENDPGLPGLNEAADPSVVAALLGARACRVTLVRYRPGERAVLRYDVDSPAGPVVCFGKVVPSGVLELASAFAELHDRATEGDTAFVPAPTAVDERLGLLVLPAVEGRSLHELLFDDATPLGVRADACRTAGAAVARLHDGPLPAVSVTRADDIRELDAAAAALRFVDPALAGRWTSVLAELEAVGVRSEVRVASHGALRTDQIVIGPAGPALLDLDGFGAAHPARDLGNLLAYLRWRAMRRPGDGAVASAGREGVLDGYATVRPLPAEDLECHEALSLLKIAARRYRNLDVAEWSLVPELVGAAATMIGSTR